MIVVDTSVWIGHFRNEITPAVAALRNLPDPSDIIVCDLVLLECLQGARDDRHAAQLESALTAFQVERILDAQLAIEGARNFRSLRALGATPRTTIDVIIATFCLSRGYALLHQDRDFGPMVTHLGLRVV